ncbi:MAG: hypothetical protein LBI14_06510, partial [Treponema sp.]|nr:hypothetical protein [Treponema sp.]
KKTIFLVLFVLIVAASVAIVLFGKSEIELPDLGKSGETEMRLPYSGIFGESYMELPYPGISGDPYERLPYSELINPLRPDVDESMIPPPAVQYELPEALIGEFVMVSAVFDHYITIYPSNKFIVITRDTSFFHGIVSCGHIVMKDDKWYFSPVPPVNIGPSFISGGYIKKLTEIRITDTGFSFYLDEDRVDRDRPLISMRKEDMPLPEYLLEEITVLDRRPKHQYFSFENTDIGRVDYNEVLPFPNSNTLTSYYLNILYGIVIIKYCYANGERLEAGSLMFRGFIEKTEETDDSLKGIIRFENGSSYHYIEDGTAEIEIKSDGSIIISMLYSPNLRYINPELSDEVQFPAKLILEY